MPTALQETSLHVSFESLRVERLGTGMTTEITELAGGDDIFRLIASTISASQ